MIAWPPLQLPVRSLVLAILVLALAPAPRELPPPVHPAPSTPTRRERVTIRIESSPSDAVVETVERIEGRTPLTLHVEKGPSFDIRVKLPGYRSVVRAVVPDVNKDLVLILDAGDPPSPARDKGRPKARRFVVDDGCTLCPTSF